MLCYRGSNSSASASVMATTGYVLFLFLSFFIFLKFFSNDTCLNLNYHINCPSDVLESALVCVLKRPHTVTNALFDTSFEPSTWSFKFVHVSLFFCLFDGMYEWWYHVRHYIGIWYHDYVLFGSAPASILVADNSLEQTIQQLMDMGGGIWDKETVTRALRAAYNNPERAVDYLYSVCS